MKIVDEFTGRIMEGRRWSEGLHQAVEAKEGVKIQEEHQTLATITLQNYFRLYEKLAGMTGTAKTEEKEFVEIYNLDVVEIPTNVAVARADENDLVFKTKEGKFAAVVRDIEERAQKGQPVLVGTIAVETSEYLSQLLTRKGVKHNVLNAKEHAREAEIIKDAGQRGAVTIATNMAGRGVDIKLGDGVVDARRPLRPRHRAPRVAPDRQPAPRPLGPPGRPRRDALLPLRRGRPRPPLRRRPDQGRSWSASRSRRTSRWRRRSSPARSRARRRRSRSRTSSCARTSSSTTTSSTGTAGGSTSSAAQVLEGEDLSEQIKLWIEEVVEDTVNLFTQDEYAEEWDLEALTQAMAQLYQTEITATELREDLGEISREALIEEFQTDASDEYAGEGGGVRRRADARARALHRPPGRRRALARAPREHGSAARGHPPALDGAEGSARRVHAARASGCSPSLARMIRSEVVLHLFHAELAPGGGAAAAAADADRRTGTSTTSTRPRRAPR